MKKLALAITATSGATAFFAHHDAQASTQHTVQSGESLWSIAQQYDTSVEDIKQQNQLSNNIVFPGQVITVSTSSTNSATQNPPQYTEASSHTVQAGETLNTIANQYGVSVDQLMSANNLNNYIIMPNQVLTIPTSGQTQVGTQNASGYDSPIFNHSNLYTAGQCTWYVFDKRAESGQPISTYWSDAKYWAENAANDGYAVDHTPTVGSIMQTTVGPFGHVGYVERINGDGSILISEMNYTYGPYNTDYRTIPASEVSLYAYIH